EHYELELMQKAGLSAEQIIALSTRNGAELLGIADSKGTLEVGKEADLLLVKGDVSQNIRATRDIVSVWDDGKQVSDGPLRDAALKDKWRP
ncbi:MAG: amidohydrolase family protein, partial [Alphaproteobacteria bacterium]|nr:amidohydrolase family protein [Alphaproteobacteria bacterium]